MDAIQQWQMWLAGIGVAFLGWGLKQVYTVLKEIKQQLVNMNQNILRHDMSVNNLESTVKDHETRIRVIEKKP